MKRCTSTLNAINISKSRKKYTSYNREMVSSIGRAMGCLAHIYGFDSRTIFLYFCKEIYGMVKFKIIAYNPIRDECDLEGKVNRWLNDHPNICIQNVTIVRDKDTFIAPINVLIFYEEKENNNE